MPIPEKPRLLALGDLPPELHSTLEARYDLVDIGSMPNAAGYRIAVTTSMLGADAGVLDRTPDLELIACNGAGLEKFDLAETAKRGIEIANTPDAVTQDTADFAIAMMFAASRRLVEADRFIRAGRWGPERMTVSRRLSGRTVGLLGLGRIGGAIAAGCAALGMTVLYSKPRPDLQSPYGFVASVTELAAASDILVLACSGGERTRGIVDARVLESLGRDGFLVNISRGTVVDEAALLEALKRRAIAGAALDVFASEPRIDPRFLQLDNVVLSPHYAAATAETRQDMANYLRDRIAKHLAGAL